MKKNVLLIIALFIASLNLRPAINSIAPLLESIRSDLGMSAAVASLLTAIPVLCMGIFSPVAVKAGGKWGIERIIGLSLVIIGIGTVIRLFTNSVLFLVTTAFIAGIGIALIGPLLSGFIKQHFPNHVPSMVAVYTVALTLGAAFSSALSTTLENSFNSWQISLAFWAIIAFVAAVIWWLFVNQQVKKSAHTATAGTKVQLPWGNGKAWILTLSFGLMAMLFYSITAWLPQIIEGMGYTKNYATIALTIFVAVQIPVSLVLPILLKRFPSRRLWLVVESILELVGLILLVLNVEPLVASALIGIGAGGLFSLNLLLPIDATDNAHEAASWSAMIQSAGYVIGALGPIILGWIHDATNSFVSAVFGMIVIVLIMSIFQFTATAKRRVNTFKEKAQDSGGKQYIV
ncbi:MFS transporter [Neobacillus thermocopriae]|uniref:MFS transporter n=1 Tax=Neobacillus thermocopriae TaxID=1215031 RepID=A0A6B3TQG7_9BACI|nr:MFS transporter [Neobacillus thermocopriae]NEX79244.1 MFS transporter [Neobacillus thermocopriae]